MNLVEYRAAYPWNAETIAGKEFRYRHLRNESSELTVVCLVGGIGLSDLAYSLCERLAERASVITFDYPEAFGSLEQTCDAIAALLKRLDVRAYLLGQSLGGMVAQLIQVRHPEVVRGLVLSNTGSLSADIQADGLACYRDMMRRQRKALWLIRLLPLAFLKRAMRKGIEAKLRGNTDEEKRSLQAMLSITLELLTKRYELHMIGLLVDLERYLVATNDHFKALQGRVLILSADDDTTFNAEIKRALEASMPSPNVHRFSRGGHLAPFLNLDETARVVSAFIDEAEERGSSDT